MFVIKNIGVDIADIFLKSQKNGGHYCFYATVSVLQIQ